MGVLPICSLSGEVYARLWSQAGLRVPAKNKRRRAIASAAPRPKMPDQRNTVWSYDFVYDACANGQTIKCLTVVDEYTRECLAIDVAGSIRSKRVIDVLSKLISVRGAPRYLRSDNGPEFVATKLLEWAMQEKLESVLIVILASHGKTVLTKASTENSEMNACQWSGLETDLKHE